MDERMDDWGWNDEWEWMDEWMRKCMDEWMNERTRQRMKERVDEWIYLELTAFFLFFISVLTAIHCIFLF